MSKPRYFAIIPAAGQSTRMGQPKLLLPLHGKPLIAWTIAAWQQSRVDHVLIVVRPDDHELAEAVRRAGAEAVIPSVAPPDMKASIQAALRSIEQHGAPSLQDAFLVAPADMPRLSPAIIHRLVELHQSGCREQILVPELRGERGHPVLFPWAMAANVFQLNSDEGLNAIVDRSQPRRVPCADLVAQDDNPFADIDTPADYRQLSNPGETGLNLG